MQQAETCCVIHQTVNRCSATCISICSCAPVLQHMHCSKQLEHGRAQWNHARQVTAELLVNPRTLCYPVLSTSARRMCCEQVAAPQHKSMPRHPTPACPRLLCCGLHVLMQVPRRAAARW
jgi:hypothetical protein